jgi:hypothetical protein
VVPGADWGESIIDAIESSRIMILIFSRSADASSQIKREVERAVNKGVYIIPFRVDDIPPTRSLEYFISTSQWMDAFSPPLEPHLDNLAKTVTAVLKRPPLPAATVPVQPEKPPTPKPPIRPSWRKSLLIAITTAALVVVGSAGWYLAQWLGGSNKPEGSAPQPRLESSTRSLPSTITKVPILKDGGTPGTQHSPQLDQEVDFETAGDLRVDFQLTNKACSEIRLRIFLDGKPLKQTDFFDEKMGILDLGPVSSGKHTLKLSPEGRVGECNTGHLGSWSGTLMLYTSENKGPPESSNNGWLTFAQYQREFDARKSEFYPANIEGRCHNGREEFRAVWKNWPLGSAFESHHVMTKQQFEDRGNALREQGYSLVFSSVFQDCNDVTRYQATWLKKN